MGMDYWGGKIMDQEQESGVESDWGVENESGEGRPQSSWWLLLLPVLGGLTGWFAMLLVCYVLPAKYESVAVIQIHWSEPELDPFGDSPESSGRGLDVRGEALRSEFEILTAQQTLMRVVERLDLATRWNMSSDRVLAVLEAVVETERVVGTDLVKIRVRHTSVQDARDIAEKVPEAYQQRRLSIETDRAQKALNSLDAELRNQEDLVVEKRKVLDTIMQAIRIPYVEGRGMENLGLMPMQDYADAERELDALEQERVRLKADFKVLLTLKSEEIMEYAPFLEAIPGELHDRRRDYLVEKAVLEEMARAGRDEGGLDVIRQRAMVAVLKDEMERGVVTFREAMQTRLHLLEGRMETARSAVESWRDRVVDMALETHDFVEAKREYENAQAMLQSMKRQLSMKRIALKIPKNPITIHEKPREGRAPVSPDGDLYLTTGMFGGAGIGGALALLIAGVRRGRVRVVDDEWADD
jgi:uncharacterized protein involved in exopolysaccharide biosynthesis